MVEAAFKEIADFISRVGFPIFVAVYFLVKIEPVLHGINETQAAILEYLRTDVNIKKA